MKGRTVKRDAVLLKTVVFALFAITVLAIPIPVQAALPAPSWLPGQPMIAGGQVIAVWAPVPGAVKYYIYVNGRKMTEVPANQYMGSAPDVGGEHIYEITAVDGSGAESPRSLPGKIVVKIIQAPKAPVFRMNPRDKSVTLRWSSPEGVSIFNVYRALSEKGPYTILASVQEPVYEDRGLEIGKSYFYAVTAKDVVGKESPKSESVEVKLEDLAAEKKLDEFSLNIIPSKNIKTLSGLAANDVPVEMPTPTCIKQGPDGKYYMLNRSDKVYVLSPELKLQKSFTVKPPEGIRKLDLYSMYLLDGKEALVTDLNNSKVFIVDLDSMKITRSISLTKPTEGQNSEVYKAMAERMRERPALPLCATPLGDGTIWVSDGQGGIIHHVTLEGRTLGWFAHYVSQGKDGRKRRLPIVPEMLTLPDGTVVLSTGVGRTILRLAPETKKAVYVIGEAATMVGRFIGFGGLCLTPDGTSLVVTDPTLNTIQGFDLDTGKYHFSIGGPAGVPDPDRELRADTDFVTPFYPVMPADDTLVFFNKIEKKFDMRRLLKPLPVPSRAK